MSAPTFTLPESVFSLTNWLLTTPEGQSVFPDYANLVNRVQGASGTIPHAQTIEIAGTPHRIFTRDPIADAYTTIEGVDALAAPWLTLNNLSLDPRGAMQTALQNRLNYYGSRGLDPSTIVAENALAVPILTSSIAEGALRTLWGDLDVLPDEQNRLINTIFNMSGGTGGTGIYGALRGSSLPSVSSPSAPAVGAGDPLYQYTQQLLNDYNFQLGGNPFTSPGYGFQTTQDQWKQLLTDAGVQFTPESQNVVPFPGANPMSTTSGNELQTLNYLAPFLSLLAGGYADADGWHPLDDANWLSRYGAGGIFGTTERDAINDLLNPLPLSEQEQGARGILSSDPQVRAAALAKYPDLANALGILDNQVIPGFQKLLDENLYSPEQYNLVEQLARTGNRGLLQDAAMTWLTKDVAPNLAAAYGGQLGTFGSDFSGELANQSRLMQADLAPIVNQNMVTGLGMWGDMTSGEKLFDSQLLPQLEAAAVRRGNLPMAWATDLSNLGGAFRATDEARRPGRIALDMYRQLLTGAAPSNLGYVMQGEQPSETASWLNGLAQQSAAFGSGLGGLIPSLAQGLGSSLANNLFQGGGLDRNGNFGLLGDLGGLLGGLGSSLFSGISGLFGGGNSSGIFGNNNWSGGSGNDFWNWA